MEKTCALPDEINLQSIQDVGFAEINKFLGVITDFTDLAEKGVVLLYVEEERRRKLLDELRSIRTRGLTPSQASKLTGKLQFTLSWSFGRIGRAASAPLASRSDRGTPAGRHCRHRRRLCRHAIPHCRK